MVKGPENAVTFGSSTVGAIPTLAFASIFSDLQGSPSRTSWTAWSPFFDLFGPRPPSECPASFGYMKVFRSAVSMLFLIPEQTIITVFIFGRRGANVSKNAILNASTESSTCILKRLQRTGLPVYWIKANGFHEIPRIKEVGDGCGS